ncbi:MAG: hypothetical protein IPL46_32645 [Saprospiraceae bacterium]|nr:hypothetical protein [Saprospiraceae bacterium]
MEITEVIANLNPEHFPIDQEIVWKIVFDQTLTPYTAILKTVRNHLKVEGFRAGFSLIFTTHQTDQHYTQGIYNLIHPVLGNLPLFMVPLGPESDGRMQYEIIFN